MIAAAASLLDRAVADGVTPGAQLCVIRRGSTLHLSCHGLLARGGAAVTEDALYDVASVTKAAATALVAHVLLSRGAIELSTPARSLLPDLRADPTVADLLGHSAGLPAWRPLFASAMADPVARALFPGAGSGRTEAFRRARALVLGAALSCPPERPSGRAIVYSDIGFMILGELLSRAGGAPMDRLFADGVAGPLGLNRTRFFDLSAGPPPLLPIAATGTTRPRQPAPGQEGLYDVPEQAALAVPGEVDDDNAYAMSGIAGHAGLFSTAAELARLGWLLLEELAGARRLGSQDVLSAMVAPRRLAEGPARAFGFDVPAAEDSAAGRWIGRGPRGAFGHLGFTGVSLWVDRDRELSVALLTNRVHETRAGPERIKELRQRVHDAVCEGARDG